MQTIPVVANVTGLPLGAEAVSGEAGGGKEEEAGSGGEVAYHVPTPDEIRASLVEQVTSTVEWVASVRYCRAQGVTHFLELGPGRILSGLVRRIVPDARCLYDCLPVCPGGVCVCVCVWVCMVCCE